MPKEIVIFCIKCSKQTIFNIFDKSERLYLAQCKICGQISTTRRNE